MWAVAESMLADWQTVGAALDAPGTCAFGPQALAVMARWANDEGIAEFCRRMTHELCAAWYRRAAQNIARSAAELQRISTLIDKASIDGSVVAGAAPEAPRRDRFVACSAGDGGVFSLSDGACMVCELRHCVECLKPHAGSECAEADRHSAAAILSHTKACPNAACAAPIMKSSGCDQMFCTRCRTVFNWETLAIERKVFHNPYFFELTPEEQTAVRRAHRAGDGDDSVSASFLSCLGKMFHSGSPDFALFRRITTYYDHLTSAHRSNLAADEQALGQRDFEVENRRDRLERLLRTRLPRRALRQPPEYRELVDTEGCRRPRVFEAYGERICEHLRSPPVDRTARFLTNVLTRDTEARARGGAIAARRAFATALLGLMRSFVAAEGDRTVPLRGIARAALELRDLELQLRAGRKSPPLPHNSVLDRAFSLLDETFAPYAK